MRCIMNHDFYLMKDKIDLNTHNMTHLFNKQKNVNKNIIPVGGLYSLYS